LSPAISAFGLAASSRAIEGIRNQNKTIATQPQAASAPNAPRHAEPDPTGAGDCFGGTFLSALVLGNGAADALKMANAAGALVVTRRGPMEGNSDPAQIDLFIKERSDHA
jgi:sugar/nucleoside kinase (ribokinase family)